MPPLPGTNYGSIMGKCGTLYYRELFGVVGQTTEKEPVMPAKQSPTSIVIYSYPEFVYAWPMIVFGFLLASDSLFIFSKRRKTITIRKAITITIT